MSTHEKSWFQKIIGVKMAPEAHLIDTRWFRGAIVIPVGLALLVGWIFTGDLSLELDRSPEGMNNFLKMFKLPLGIASLSLPIVAVVAANHRSMQTAKQIQEQNAQNIFSNHLEHRDFFAKFIEERKPFDKLTIDTARLYEALFPFAVEGDLRPNLDLLDELLIEIIDTIFTARLQTEKHLNEYNFKLPTESANSLEDIIKRTDQNISFRAFPITATDTRGLFDDPISVIRTIRTRYLIVGKGLIQASNFHRYYGNSDKLNTVVAGCKDIDNLLSSVSEIYPIYKDIKLINEEFLTTDGKLKTENGNSEHEFLVRLENVRDSMLKNNKNMNLIENIFNHHIDKSHRPIFYASAPGEWTKYLKLSNQEEKIMLNHKFGKR